VSIVQSKKDELARAGLSIVARCCRSHNFLRPLVRRLRNSTIFRKRKIGIQTVLAAAPRYAVIGPRPNGRRKSRLNAAFTLRATTARPSLGG